MAEFKAIPYYREMAVAKGVNNSALGLWLKAGDWSARHETYGVIPKKMLRTMGGTVTQAENLVKCGTWEHHPEGYKFLHWRKYQDGNYRRNVRKSVKEAVYERDGYACVQCGATENLSLDHIIRYADDGPDTVENLRVLCMPCNINRELNRR